MDIQKPARALQPVQTIDASKVVARIAIASSDRIHINEHFGTASNFLIFTLIEQQWHLQKVIEYGQTERQHNQNKLISRMDALAECNAVYSNAVGPSAVKQLLKKSIQPMIVNSDSDIKTLLKQLLIELNTKKAGWLNRINKADKNDSTTREKMLALLNEQWD